MYYALEELTNRERQDLINILIKNWADEDVSSVEIFRADELIEKMSYDD